MVVDWNTNWSASGTSEIIDISPPLDEQLAVFPGDTPFSRKVLADFESGADYRLTTLTLTSHAGAHTDAPNHYSQKTEGIDGRDLRYYLGDCQVVEVDYDPQTLRVMLKHLPSSFEIKTQRILFRTNSFPASQGWTDDFAALSPEVIELLAKNNVRLVGIDTPSIDPAKEKNLVSHHCIAKNNMAILETVDLSKVSDGRYVLIALPLKIVGGDASPVRAVLIREGQ